ncbi:MAG: hypothetical protein C0483_03030 [Pirellula sp.]|nr:hypothetical protein [Pirellula sp.]
MIAGRAGGACLTKNVERPAPVQVKPCRMLAVACRRADNRRMKSTRSRTAALLCLLLFSACERAHTRQPAAPVESSPAPVTSKLSAAETEAFVAFHNKARAEVGSAPVRWSPKLASFAQAWAEHLAVAGKLEHRPLEGDDASPYGECLAAGSSSAFSAVDGAKGWYAEKEMYEPGTPIPIDITMWKAGHYTQMVWSTTREIGAGRAVIAEGAMQGWTVIVCNYDPPGNAEGETPYPLPAAK